MPTKIVSGERVFGQPEIDGGTFTASLADLNVLIIARTFRVETGWVVAISSSGVTRLGTASAAPFFERFNTITSAGLSLVGTVSVGQTYAWGTFGVGG